MCDVREELRARAFHVGDGPDYNEVSQRIREDAVDVPVVVYEMVLDTSHGWPWLRDDAIPRFVRYLRHKRLSATDADGVVVTIFDGQEFLLLRGPQLFAFYREQERLDLTAFEARVRQWLADGPERGGLPALIGSAPAPAGDAPPENATEG